MESFARIVVGALLAAIIGYERDRHGRPAGLRTHTLVGLASATFMVVSTRFVYFQGYGHDVPVEVDASRIAASVVSGIGFLAGGAILRTGPTIQGLTTAAGLWLVTAIGLAAGGGMYAVAAFTTTIGVCALTLLRRFEDKDDRLTQRQVLVEFAAQRPDVEGLLSALVAAGVHIVEREYDRDVAVGALRLTLDLRYPAALGVERVLDLFERREGIQRVRLVSSSPTAASPPWR